MQFSVIVPVYNVEPYLRQCLDSLVNQTYEDQEIIVVDDGSTDSSGEICDAYGDQYPFVTVIHQENQGLSGARNTGLKAAKGEWISFVDGDDWAQPDMLEILAGHILASNADLYRVSFWTVSQTGEEIKAYLLGKQDTVYNFPDERGRFRFYFEIFMNTVRVWGGAYRRSIIEEHGITFVDNRQIYAEDLLFNFQYMLYVKKIVYLSNLSYNYRKREGSLMDTTIFKDRMIRVGILCERAYQVVMQEKFPYFQQHFYELYFKILNRFILRDGADSADEHIRQVLDLMDRRRFHRVQMGQIRAHGREFKSYTKGRVWYKKNFGNERIWKLANRVPLIWRIWFLVQNVRYRREGNTAFPPSFMNDSAQKVAYLSMPKAACTSITASMMKRNDIPDDYSIFRVRRPFVSSRTDVYEGWFVFTFVRNPFERLVSCYENKYHTDITKNSRARERGFLDLDFYLHGYMKEDKGFGHFIDQVSKIPWRMDNKHFASQYYRIVDNQGKLLVDYVGKFEHLKEDYEPIRKRYGYAPLKVYNKSKHGDWRDYYTERLAKKVYRKYKKDVQYFGYEQDYRDLLAYCREKERRS